MGKVSVDAVVRFCFEKFLDAMRAGKHNNPFEDVRKAVMAEFGVDGKTAHSICRPPYWVLMNEKILELCYDNGCTCWKLVKNYGDVDVESLVKKTLGTDKQKGEYDYRPTMEARLENLA